MKNKEVQESLRQVGIRLIEEPPLLSPEPMSSPEAAVRVLGEWLSEMDRELFCVVNLNFNLTPINMNVVSMGALNVAYVHPRDAMKSAILSNAAYMMLIHNHPSGSMTPSKEDIKITDQIQSAASLMGIPVLDHIIVGRHQEFFSIRENNVFSYQNDMQYTSDISKLRWTQQSSVAESTSYGGQNSEVPESKMDTIMNSLERGVHEIFTSEKYHIYLNTMSKFHNYSFNNTLLIAMQRPDATLVAGYQTWKKKFNRQVQRGEKGIKIIAPAPIKEKRRVEKVDEETQEIVIGDDGQPETEIVEHITPRFRVTTVFDVSQTEGEPLPTLGTTELEGNVVIYEDFMKGLEELSPVPFRFEDIGNGAKGYYSEKYIAIQRDMSNAQTMKTAVHETAHAILHDRDIMQENGVSKDRTTKEVEAESVAYVVCSHFGLDTSEYSFSYIAGWSSNKEMSELRNSMDTIRVTSSKLIEDITEKLIELRKEKAMEEEEIMESVSEKERDETEQEDRTNENSFFERTDDSYAIYQYDNTDGNWGYKFMGLSIISNMGLSVDGKDYRMMFMEQLHEHDSLDELYHRFNAERPEGFDGHSLSVSDVVIMKRNGEMKAYYVDDVGFSELPEFTKQREQIIDRSNDSPVYAGTLEQAVRQKDADAYLDSRKLNIDCKKAIEEAIQENYDGIRLKDDVAKDVVRRFGEERMNFVMANTIRESFLEGRFSKQNKEWAEHINIPENISHGRNLNLDYIIESHPVVLDDFISMARFEIRMLKIERAIEDAEVPITADTNDYVADGHEGAWHTIEERKYAGEKFFLMEHNEFGSNVAEIIVTENGQLVAEDLWNGFDKGALEAISEYLQDKGISVEEIYKEPDELAYKIHDGYFSIHRTDGGYDYTFYTKDYEDTDGGIYDNPDSPIKQVVEDILEDAGISLDDAEWMDYEELDAEVEHAEEIKQLAVDLDKFSYEYDTYEYKDSIEDREEQIDKLTEDILTRKTSDIKKWLIEVSENSEIDNDVRTARSLFSRLEEAERVFISDETNVSFYAAECMEFPDFGELHENLTLDEAIKKYESIPEERMHGVKGIGFELEDGSDYEGKYGLMYHGRVDRENVEMIQYYKDNPVIQKALDALEQYCETSADKSVERQQETNRKKKQKSIYQGLHR